MPIDTSTAKRASVALGLTVGFGLVGLVIALLIGGGAAAQTLADPGDVVRWGLPISKLIFNFSIAVAVGAAAFAAFAISEDNPLLQRVLNLSGFAGIFWVISAAANFLFTYLSVTGSAFSGSESFSNSLQLFATQIQLGQYLALNLIGAVLFSTIAFAVRRLTATLLLAVLGFASLVPIALTGHAAGTANHSMAVNAIGIHLVAVILWVGGLVTLFVVRGRDYAEAALHTSRYSSLALVSFILVSVSGFASAIVRLPNASDWFSNYGLILLLKISAIILLGVLGVIYRRRVISKIAAGANQTATFFKLVAVEFVIMGSAIGFSTALARTAPPVDPLSNVGTTPAEILTGEKLPPQLTAMSFITAWKIDLLWLVICVGTIIAYVAGVYRLRKRGDQWSWMRTTSWLLGMLTLIYVTSGALNAYQEYLFSMHMIGHMVLAMGIPVLLVGGAPVTLLLRAVEKRKDNSRGVREWVLWAVHTKYMQFVGHPLVAAVLFATSLVTFYYTPLFSWATREHVGHEWMVVHFLITGYLFAQALIGIDPGPKRLGYPIRLGLLIVTMAFHAFFGLSLMSGNGLLLAEWFGAMGRTWGQDPMADQQTGGAIAWGIGELPTAALTIIVCVQWFAADRREAVRLDRASDRTGNADVEEYNRMLQKLAKRDERS